MYTKCKLCYFSAIQLDIKIHAGEKKAREKINSSPILAYELRRTLKESPANSLELDPLPICCFYKKIRGDIQNPNSARSPGVAVTGVVAGK